MKKDFKTIISKKCTCDGNVCQWCVRQEEMYYDGNYEIKTHRKELYLDRSIDNSNVPRK